MFNPLAKLSERFAAMRPWRRRVLIAAAVAFYFLYVYNTGITAFDDFLYKIQCYAPCRDVIRNRGVSDGIGHRGTFFFDVPFPTKYVYCINGEPVVCIDVKDESSPVAEISVSMNNVAPDKMCGPDRLGRFHRVFTAYFDKRDSRYLYSWLRYVRGCEEDHHKQAPVLVFDDEGGPRNADCVLHDINAENVALDGDIEPHCVISIGDVVITPGASNPITPRRRAGEDK